MTSGLDVLRAASRGELARHGVEPRALMPLARIFPPPAQHLWLGTCPPPTAARLPEVLRRAAGDPRVRVRVREANERGVRDLMPESGGRAR
ncbi:hypothetical protein [Streptomyces sp. URMC 129]|uniref:hypothetical protein n=1 Tax=Streptomyces sp. URMC 129 TaxID=3423407 RepID=UPI003F1C35B7